MKQFFLAAMSLLCCCFSLAVASQPQSELPPLQKVEIVEENRQQEEKKKEGLHPIRITAGMGVLGVLLVWLFIRKDKGQISPKQDDGEGHE